MSLKLKNRNTCPPGHNFPYIDPDTKIVIGAPSFSALERKVWNHRVANNLVPLPDTAIEDIVCRQLIDRGCAEYCIDSEHSFLPIVTGFKVTFDQVKRGTLTIASNLIRGNPLVEQAEADRRSRLCAKCPYNVDPEGCTPCTMGAVRSLVKAVVGNRVTVEEASLKSCAFCGCFNASQVWFPLDVLQKFMRKEINDNLPGFCWKKST